ncbi:MAG TPA: hypothetical protein DHV30_03755, partial [Balneola sp.]|nr:hypothetical protein [Balneola sp.]
MYKIFSVLVLAFLLVACDPIKKEAGRLLTQEYPDLYEAVYARDDQALMEFTSHKDERVRMQAWQALINTPVNDITALIDLATKTDTRESWASLWLKELSEEQIERLNELFIASNASNIGLVSVLGELGNSRSLELLLEEDVPPNQEMEFQLAYAIGRLTGNIEANEEQQIQIIERALSTTNSKASQAYLYGFYRTRNDQEKQGLTQNAVNKMIELWKNYYPDEIGSDRYIAALLMKDHSGLVFHHFIDKDFILMDVQLAIEIIQAIGRNEENDTYAPVALNAFVQHKNPNVVIQALRVIAAKEDFAKEINNSLLNATALNVAVEPHVRLAGFNASVNPEKY